VGVLGAAASGEAAATYLGLPGASAETSAWVNTYLSSTSQFVTVPLTYLAMQDFEGTSSGSGATSNLLSSFPYGNSNSLSNFTFGSDFASDNSLNVQLGNGTATNDGWTPTK